MPLRGIRGATTVNKNSSQEILDETKVLLEKMFQQNQVIPEDVASIFFSVTEDINAEFPAKAAREIGFINTPLLCLNEIPVPGSLGQCIRILAHINSDKPQADMKHIYLKEACSLRPDQSPGA